MNIFKRVFGTVAKAANPEIFAYYYNKAFPNPRKINYEEAYTSWVFACIDAIASDTAKIELVYQKKNKDGDWQEVDNAPALELLLKPNPTMTGMDLLSSISSWKQIDGNSFLYVAYNLNNKPMELWPLNPTRMIILKDELKIVDGYNYLNNIGHLVPLRYTDVVHLKTFNPADAYRGIGKVEAARVAIETDVFSTKWNRNLFENSATPEAVLQTDKKLSDEVYKRLKASWNNEYRGVANSHKTAILEEGLALKPTQLNPKEADFLALRGFTRDELCAIFGVPKLRLGFIEGTNRASADTIEYVYVKNTILNEIMFIVDKLNAFYLPLWGVDSTKERIYFKNPVPDDEQLLIEKKASGLANGYLKINEVRAMDNLEPVDGGDRLYIPVLMQPLPTDDEIVAQQEETPDENSDNPEDDNTVGNSLDNKKTKTASASYKEQQMVFAKRDMKTIYGKMEQHILSKLVTNKSVKRSKAKTKNPTLKRLKDALDNSDDDSGIAIAADASIQDQALSDFSDVFTPVVLNYLKGFVPDVYQKGGDTSYAAAGISGVFDLKNPRATEWINNHALEMATQIPDTVKGDMATVIQQGIANGDSIQNIATNISGYFDEGADWRSLRVARSEVMMSYRAGTMDGKLQAGEETKEWEINSDRPCPLCEENAGVGEIPINQDFPNGDDPHPNCTCDVR